MKQKKVKKEAKNFYLTAEQINRMIVNDELWGVHLSYLIAQDVCVWFNDNHPIKDGRFRATAVEKVQIMNDKHGDGVLYINFVICVEQNDIDEVVQLPHFGCWRIFKDGMILEPRLEFFEDGNTEYIMPGYIEICPNGEIAMQVKV